MTAIQNTSNGSVRAQIEALMPEHLKKDTAYINLVRSIHSVAYMEQVTGQLQRYMKYRKINSCKKLVQEEKKAIEGHLSDYLADSSKRMSNRSKRVAFAAIKLFYVQNDVILNWPKLSKQIGHNENVRNRDYKREEIETMLQHADYRGRVIVLLLASTGMRIGAIPALNVGDLRVVERDMQKMYAITVYRGEPEEYVTFCTPECAKAIDHYLDFRRRIREPVSQSSPLIRNAVDVETAENNPDNRLAKRMEETGVRHILRKLVVGSGVKSKLAKSIDRNGVIRYEVHLTRGFRKSNYKGIVKAKVEPIHREALVGHKKGTTGIEADSLAMIYGTPEESELFASYATAIDNLTIDQSQTLAKKNEELKDQLQTATVTRKEFEDLKLELFRQLERQSAYEGGVRIPADYALDYLKHQMSKMTPEEVEEKEARFMKRQDDEQV